MEVRQFHGGQVLAGGMWSSGTSHIDQTDGVGGAVTLWGAHGERGRGKVAGDIRDRRGSRSRQMPHGVKQGQVG